MSSIIQKRLAADILKAGESRIWIDPNSADEVSKAITREDVRGLIVRNVIQLKPKIGVSRGRAKKLAIQRGKGRRKGQGQRKGLATARTPEKREWMNKVRALRQMLATTHNKGTISSKEYRDLYMKIKGNFFRNRAHLKSYVEKMKKE
ncbi:MAG: 50S ribosomal protein L19e [Candidatus Nanoarchaeia archaeon]|nr:50S ribosomal protein L19e [Candidatus Nanoarchaeia archaeon]MDD5239653.1 50S ribosomal protein L19e [Candidatus Nanoarchaeia archaeon]